MLKIVNNIIIFIIRVMHLFINNLRVDPYEYNLNLCNDINNNNNI